MRTTMLRTALLVTGGAVLVTAACADGGKNPVAPESRAAVASGRNHSFNASGKPTGGTAKKGVVDQGAEVSKVDDCTIPLDDTGLNVLPNTSGHFVVSSSGNFHLICHATLPIGFPLEQSAQVLTVDCVTPETPATPGEGHVVITPSGRVHLVCHGQVPVGDDT